jgi:hypothetical protein
VRSKFRAKVPTEPSGGRDPKPLPPIAYLRSRLTYNAKDGAIRWRKSNGRRCKAGAIAGCVRPGGARFIALDGVAYAARRIAWALHYGQDPPGLINLKNRDLADAGSSSIA